jgi:hypothetical protein
VSAQAQVILYSTLLSLIITYAWWVHFRIWILRQDLFAIRDRLWDRMQESGQFDDPQYRATRDGINAMIRFAPYLSLRVMALVLASDTKVETPHGPLRKEIEEVRKRIFIRVFRYLFVETLSGLFILSIVLVFLPMNMAMKQVHKWVSRVFDSTDVRMMDVSPDELDPCELA